MTSRRRRWGGDVTVDDVRAEVTTVLADLERLFDLRCKLTFVMRAPFAENADMVITNDPDMNAVAAAILKLYSGAAPLHPASNGATT